jgi:hypothetical protein
MRSSPGSSTFNIKRCSTAKPEYPRAAQEPIGTTVSGLLNIRHFSDGTPKTGCAGKGLRRADYVAKCLEHPNLSDGLHSSVLFGFVLSG